MSAEENFIKETGKPVVLNYQEGMHWTDYYVEWLEEQYENSRRISNTPILSAVPSGKESNDALNDYVGFIASIPEIQDKKSGWRECYNWMIEELKRRGIAG